MCSSVSNGQMYLCTACSSVTATMRRVSRFSRCMVLRGVLSRLSDSGVGVVGWSSSVESVNGSLGSGASC